MTTAQHLIEGLKAGAIIFTAVFAGFALADGIDAALKSLKRRARNARKRVIIQSSARTVRARNGVK
jgi:hypothetical protein